RIRRFGWGVMPLAAMWGAMTNEIWFPDVPRFSHGVYLAGLVALSALYWYREPARQRLAAAAISLAAFAGANLRWLYLALEESPLARGLPWLAWGLGSLAVAIYVSLLKAGIVAKFAATVRMIGNGRMASRRLGPPDKFKRQ